MTKCRFCNHMEFLPFADLTTSPFSNSYVKKENLNKGEIFYPLIAKVCKKCFLTQIEQYENPDKIFNEDYAYFSSYSKSWLAHCKEYADKIVGKLSLNQNSLVTEIASNDGYLLQFFKEKSIPNIGIEPTDSTAQASIAKGIHTIIKFFGINLANDLLKEFKKSDLVIGNNVIAHVPDINDFVGGVKIILSDQGTANFEFPHLLNLIQYNQFDTIYHEHFSYFSLYTINQIFQHHNLMIYDVEEIKTHGGSLRIYVCHKDAKPQQNSVAKIIEEELNFGINKEGVYLDFQKTINSIKMDLLNNLIKFKQNNKSIVAYGAAAKGNTLLNYCGIRTDFIDYVVDANPHKQNNYMPGSRIPIVDEKKIKETKPDCILILPWNIKEEVAEQLSYTKAWGCKLFVAVPEFLEI